MKQYITLILLLFTLPLFAQEVKNFDFGRFRVGADISRTYGLGKNEAVGAQKDYGNGLRWGTTLAVDLSFYIKPTWGFGVKYSNTNTSNTMGAQWDKIRTSYIGPSFVYRKTLGHQNKWALFGTISYGYLHVKDKGQFVAVEDMAGTITKGDIVSGVVTGSTLGSYLEVGAELRLAPKLYLVGAINLYDGTITNNIVTLNEVFTKSSKEKQNAGRVGFLVGLKFGLY